MIAPLRRSYAALRAASCLHARAGVALANTGWRLGILAWVAGEIDSFGYLSLGHVFITHVTGNTATWAIAMVQGPIHEAVQRAFVIGVFFAGGIAGAALVDTADDPRQISRALIVEALLLGLFAVLSWLAPAPHSLESQELLLLLLAAPMGLQNAALTHPGMRGTHTTHITGPMTDLATEVVRAMSPRRRQEFSAIRLLRMGARLTGFAIGAVCGAILFELAPVAPPLLAAGALTLVVVL
jgi:uncharacterized membrane protein YoaK (UPF0700 family)